MEYIGMYSNDIRSHCFFFLAFYLFLRFSKSEYCSSSKITIRLAKEQYAIDLL